MHEHKTPLTRTASTWCIDQGTRAYSSFEWFQQEDGNVSQLHRAGQYSEGCRLRYVHAADCSDVTGFVVFLSLSQRILIYPYLRRYGYNTARRSPPNSKFNIPVLSDATLFEIYNKVRKCNIYIYIYIYTEWPKKMYTHFDTKILPYNRNYCIYTKAKLIWEMSLNYKSYYTLTL